MQRLLNHPAIAILGPALLGFGGAVLSISIFEDYGASLFVLLPLVVSFLSAWCWTLERNQSLWQCYGMACVSLIAVGVLILVMALDGLFCLVMALPLGLIIALPGALFGWMAGRKMSGRGGGAVSLFLCLAVPCLMGFENAVGPRPVVRQVTTELWVRGSIEDVWKTVIAFPEIDTAPKGIFRFGIAYPIRASIEGEGVGAIRYCTFSTGSFVEPITVWNEPHELAFDVTHNPPPMDEFSIYEDLHVPHLDGYMQSQRGRFLLNEKDGGVLLQGTTWYTHSIAPEIYWGAISDHIIHRIHHRVLGHIKDHVEVGMAKP